MGLDVKCNLKKIHVTPGPGHYTKEIYPPASLPMTNVLCHNYKLQNGGLDKPKKLSEKEDLILLSVGKTNRT